MESSVLLLTRRDALSIGGLLFGLSMNIVASDASDQRGSMPVGARTSAPDAFNSWPESFDGDFMKVHYLEIVTQEVDSVCAMYEQALGLTFNDADQNLGGARTVKLANGGMLGVRGPMHTNEKPVVRPYLLVEDIAAAVAKAKDLGAEIAVPPMLIPGHGSCAIYFLGGVEFGLWQNS